MEEVLHSSNKKRFSMDIEDIFYLFFTLTELNTKIPVRKNLIKLSFYILVCGQSTLRLGGQCVDCNVR